MYRSKLVSRRLASLNKTAVNESAAMGTSQKHNIPILKMNDAAAQGLPCFLGGGQNLQITPVLIQDDHGVFPGIQITSQDGWVCALDVFAIDDVATVFSKLKPQLESSFQDLKLQGLIL